MTSWKLMGASEGYDEYVGHTISGAAYALFPAGRRSRIARKLRATQAYRAHCARRIGQQRVKVAFF